jgi:hypothetical protein
VDLDPVGSKLLAGSWSGKIIPDWSNWNCSEKLIKFDNFSTKMLNEKYKKVFIFAGGSFEGRSGLGSMRAKTIRIHVGPEHSNSKLGDEQFYLFWST